MVTMQLILSQPPQQWQQQQLGRRPRNCGKRHIQSSRYRTSSLLTRFSTWFNRVKTSLLLSLMSTCKVFRLAAIFSTALVSLTIAADASSLRLENPNIPIAATEMDAPSAAARISITAQANDALILPAQNPAEVLPLLKNSTPLTGAGSGI